MTTLEEFKAEMEETLDVSSVLQQLLPKALFFTYQRQSKK